MFSYRHGFHAGNHADVLKHVILVQLLDKLNAKDKPYWVIDSHAGGGAYALDAGYAAKSGEWKSGIGQLWDMAHLPPALAAYLAQIRAFNVDGQLRNYPGSPRLALQMMRPGDKLHAFEKHPTEIAVLREHFRDAGRQVIVHDDDGFAGLKAVLPPAPRRALVLIDPSYEIKDDYKLVLNAMRDALKRFATGTYAVWYPQVQRQEARELPRKLQALATGDWLHATLSVKAPVPGGLGLHGSGMFIYNPPWKLEESLRAALPVLARVLGQDDQAGYGLEFRQT